MSEKRILVTGGAGFIGSNLCKKLIDEGNYVICLDNFFTGSYDNIKNLLNNSRFKLVEHDVINPFYYDVEQIYNLACPASPPSYQFDPVKTIETSVIGITNALKLAQKNNAKILQASTSEVYGDPLIHPQKESYWGNVNPIGKRSCYDEGKRCAESLAISYYYQNKVDVRIIRIFNTYGVNMEQNDGRVVSNFIVQALKGDDITIYGDGSQTRSFCYVDDTIDAMINMMNNRKGFIGPVNIGNPGEYTILELAQMIISLTNSSSKIVYKPLPSDDPVRRKPDITLAKEKLGWEPTIKVQDGLVKTIEYFKLRYNL